MKNTLLLFASLVLLSCSNNEQNNTPNASIPVLTTNAISNINLVSASSGGNITSDGGANIIARGVIWSTSQNPTISLNTKTTDGVGMGTFTSNITSLTPNTTYYVRSYATNSAGTAYGNEISFITTSIQLPVLTTTAISNITLSTASSGGNITSDGGGSITSRGVVWSTTQNPTVALLTKTIDGSGLGMFTSSITSLTSNTQYYVRAYATNSVGTSYGTQIIFSTFAGYAQMYPTGTVFCNNIVTAVVDVTNPITGKTWMDRNLGASQVATSLTDPLAYGDLYQWGRRADGHQCRNSGVTTTLSSTDQPSHGNFISTSNSASPYDWRNPQNDNLWQGVNGINNPCPNGYRLPTENEYINEYQSWSSGNQNGAFSSSLKFSAPGARLGGGGSVYQEGVFAMYWTNTVSGTQAKHLVISGGSFPDVNLQTDTRRQGHTVRCIKN